MKTSRKINVGLLGKVLIAIALGVAVGWCMNMCGPTGNMIMRVLKTFNVFFAQLLKFIVPLLVLGLVTPAIADVGKGASKMLVFVALTSYCSTVFAAFFGWFCAGVLLPNYLGPGVFSVADSGKELLPFFSLKIPPLCDVLTALGISFICGVGIVNAGAGKLYDVFKDFGEVIKLTILRVVIPGLPIYIATMFSEMTASGKFSVLAGTMCKVIGTGWALTICLLFVTYTSTAIIVRKNPLRCLCNMANAYFTGLSIASSSAVIPVTLQCCEKNGVSLDVRNFVVPLCANIHMPGSAVKLMTSFVAISIIYGQQWEFHQIANFVFLFAIAAVAAPGVMGGVLMASLGLLETVLGFSSEQTAMMMAFYLALDGYGPATNVTSDGMIALLTDHWFGEKPMSVMRDARG